jgi:chemotaxis protein CheD
MPATSLRRSQPAADPAAAALAALKAAPRQPSEASFFFYDAHFRNNAVKVLPGEYFVHHTGLHIMTTLGSCIAVCLYDPQNRIGGLNHFMLPDAADSRDCGRYGSFAMELLINAMLKRGALRGSLQAKVFGGGRVIEGMHTLNVGERNAAFAMQYLETERIPVLSKDVLGVHPRKVAFVANSGKVMVKRLPSSNVSGLIEQERAAAHKPEAAQSGSIDLF